MVALPHGRRAQRLFVQPLQNAFIAFAQRTFEAVGAEKMHILRPWTHYKGDDAAVAPVCEREAGLLFYLAQDAVLRAFALLEFPADADPFVAVFVVFLLDAVQRQILPAALDIAETGVFPGASSVPARWNTSSS